MQNLRGCLTQDKLAFNHGKIVNIYIAYDLESNLNNSDPALENCFFGTVKLTKRVISISKNILDMVLDLIQKELFNFLMAVSVKM